MTSRTMMVGLLGGCETRSYASDISNEIKCIKEQIAMKNVLFLAPSYGYAKVVVKNQNKDLDRKKILNAVSIEPGNMYIRTEKVHVDIVYMDPVKYTPELFKDRAAVFGKRELIDAAMEKYFALVLAPRCSLAKYLADAANSPASIHMDDDIKPRTKYIPEITHAYFNEPYTIVLWDDGTKTMVKCQEGDEYSKEVGLALCVAKKSLGNLPNFNNIFRKWIPEEKEEEPIKCCEFCPDPDDDPLRARWKHFLESLGR